MTILDAVWLLALSFVAASLAVLAVVLADRRLDRGRASAFADGATGTVFLFDGDTMLDATASARALLATARSSGSAWQRFLGYAGPRFPGLEAQVDRLPELGRFDIASVGSDGLMLRAEWRSGVRRIVLFDPHADGAAAPVDALAQQAQDDELALLRFITDEAPHPVWFEDAGGRVTWANKACVALTMQRSARDGVPGWPLPRLFDPAQGTRQSLAVADGGAQSWFDLRMVSAAGGRVVHALPADSAVQAEAALGSFVQTLTKTFAHLPIGLAVFDRQRRLQLFNPALTDLSALPVDFLSARPALFAFLDAMRERGMIPEPRDYKAWRAQMSALEESAADGRYEETWALPSGLTYRVIGRPHPEGALALLIQDISDEVSRTRRMRADLEIGQSVIDAADEAIAVFSSGGQLLMANLAYARLWGQDPTETPEGQPIGTLTALWSEACAPSHFWSLAEGYVATTGPREPWISHGRLNDGRALRCRLAPLAGGATLIGFAADPLPDRHPPLVLTGDAPAPATARPVGLRAKA